jgi:hypothetical protein
MKKKAHLASLLFVFLLSTVAAAQDDFFSSRLENQSNQLKRVTVDLVDRTSEELRRGSALRALIDEAFLAVQVDASAGLFQDMVRDRRRASELRDAASVLSELVRRAPALGNNGQLWRDAQATVSDISRELGTAGGGGQGDTRPVIGRVYWRGMVDDKVQLVIRGGKLESRTVSGRSYPDGTFSFTASLPSREVAVGVTRTRGRGSVRVIQQPSPANDFTAIVEIYDDGGGAREYQLDIFWR